MITLIHGEDIVSSRQELYKIKDQYCDYEIISFSSKPIHLPQITEIFQSKSLFFEKRLIILENVIANLNEKQKEEFGLYIKNIQIDDPAVIWENKDVSSPYIRKYFTKLSQIHCKFPQLLFRFLDSIKVVTSKELISLFISLAKDKEAELIYSMMLRQYRLLIMVKTGENRELTGLSGWQISKLLNQARFFSIDSLKCGYRRLLSIEHKIKTGQTPYNLKDMLDIYLADL